CCASSLFVALHVPMTASSCLSTLSLHDALPISTVFDAAIGGPEHAGGGTDPFEFAGGHEQTGQVEAERLRATVALALIDLSGADGVEALPRRGGAHPGRDDAIVAHEFGAHGGD